MAQRSGWPDAVPRTWRAAAYRDLLQRSRCQAGSRRRIVGQMESRRNRSILKRAISERDQAERRLTTQQATTRVLAEVENTARGTPQDSASGLRRSRVGTRRHLERRPTGGSAEM